jgi:hypothetical protein
VGQVDSKYGHAVPSDTTNLQQLLIVSDIGDAQPADGV